MVKKIGTEWQTYRTRFLVYARQLNEPLRFVDGLGREHRGQSGDFLVQSSSGETRIIPRQLFEDIYVLLEKPESADDALSNHDEVPPLGKKQVHRASIAGAATEHSDARRFARFKSN